MRRSVAPIVLALPFIFLSGCHGGEGGGERGAPTRDSLGRSPAGLVEDWVGMWNAYDLDQVGELFLVGEDLTYFSSEFEGVIRGFDAVLEHHRNFGFVPGGEDRGTRLWVEGLTEDAFGDTAVLTAIWYFQRGEDVAAPDAETGSRVVPLGGSAGAGSTAPLPQRGPVTFVCILDGGRWRFAHMNFGNYLDPGDAG